MSQYGWLTEEYLRAMEEDNKVTVEIECSHSIYSFELNRACSPQQLAQSLRLFANEIEERA